MAKKKAAAEEKAKKYDRKNSVTAEEIQANAKALAAIARRLSATAKKMVDNQIESVAFDGAGGLAERGIKNALTFAKKASAEVDGKIDFGDTF